MSRRLKGNMPVNLKVLIPKVHKGVRDKLLQSQEVQKKYYNRIWMMYMYMTEWYSHKSIVNFRVECAAPDEKKKAMSNW